MMLDLIILAFFLLFVIIGLKRGAVKTLLGFVCVGVSVFIASAFSAQVSQWIYGSFFKEGIINSVDTAVSGSVSGDAAQSAVNGLPDYVYSALSHFGIEKSALLTQTNRGVTAAQSAVSVAVEEAVSPVILSVINFFAVIILFLLCMIALKLLSRLVLRLFELPGLSLINRLCGGILGFAEGFVFVYLIIVLIKLFVPLTGDGIVITPLMIDESVLFKTMYNLDIFADIELICDSVSALIDF